MKRYFLKISICLITVLLLLDSQKTVAANWDSITPIPINSSHSSAKLIRYYSPIGFISTDSILKIAKQNKFSTPENGVFTKITRIEKPVWIFLKTPSYSAGMDQYLVIDNVNFNLINLYSYEKNHLTLVSKKGMALPYSDENLFPEQISFKVNSSTIYFLEATDFYNVNLPIFVRTNNINIQKTVIKNLFNAFYWGVITVIGLVVLFLFVQTKEVVYLYYGLFLFGTIFLNLLLDGYAFAYLWPNYPIINSYKYGLYGISVVSMPLFMYHFLDIHYHFPKLKFFFIILSALFIFIPLLNILEYQALCMLVLHVTAIIQIFIYIGLGFRLFSKGIKNAFYFIIAWSIYLISVLLAVLTASDIIPSTSFLINYIQIGTLIQISIFSYILLGKYKEIKQRHIETQRKLIDILKDRETDLTIQKDELEKLVFLRTQEIIHKNNELSTLNANLNGIVDQKTFELQNSLKEIVRTNDQLKQFNYITSHNLRGPVSSLQGLMNLYKIEHSEIDKEIYVSKMKIVIDRMDEILIDLNKILSYRSTYNLKEDIHFNGIINNNLTQLGIPSKTVALSIEPELKISGIKSYFESIFYNLLSNSHKYIDQSRTLHISIRIEKSSEKNYKIIFSDNGIGMDESKTAGKIFGFYMRFHAHVEGKGLGLYITKTQIEQMGGSIRVESKPGVGSTFIIELPL